jgi:NAD(P)-dependent dehydrogenase (short-subunit alcohol dehydrogenase family)
MTCLSTYQVIMGVNSVEEGHKIIDELKTEDQEMVFDVKALHLDLSSLESVRKFAKQVAKEEPKIDVLINSGERLVGKLVITDEGFEKQFVENYLGIHRNT